MKTKTETRKPSKAKAKAARGKASVKRVSRPLSKARRKAAAKVLAKAGIKPGIKPGKARKANGKANGRGGGKALSDFSNAAKLRVLKPKEIPVRNACFKTGQTVSACLAAQKAKGFRGRRKFIRAQIAQGRISLS